MTVVVTEVEETTVTEGTLIKDEQKDKADERAEGKAVRALSTSLSTAQTADDIEGGAEMGLEYTRLESAAMIVMDLMSNLSDV